MALWPLTCSSGFGPWFQSAELPLGNGSLSTINSCLSSSHTPWARSLLPEGALLLSCVPLLPAQVTAAPNALLGTYQIFKSLFFCRKKMLITRGSHLNSADDRNHLLFVTLLPVSDGLLGKGSVYACTKIWLHWYSLGGCSFAPILIIISSSYLRGLIWENRGQWGARESSIGNTRLSELLFCKGVHGGSRIRLITSLMHCMLWYFSPYLYQVNTLQNTLRDWSLSCFVRFPNTIFMGKGHNFRH